MSDQSQQLQAILAELRSMRQILEHIAEHLTGAVTAEPMTAEKARAFGHMHKAFADQLAAMGQGMEGEVAKQRRDSEQWFARAAELEEIGK